MLLGAKDKRTKREQKEQSSQRFKSTSKQKRESRFLFLEFFCFDIRESTSASITTTPHHQAMKDKGNWKEKRRCKCKKEHHFMGRGHESRAGGTTMQGQNARLHVNSEARILFPLLFCVIHGPSILYLFFVVREGAPCRSTFVSVVAASSAVVIVCVAHEVGP